MVNANRLEAVVPREFYGDITDITKNCDLGMSETGGLKLQNEHSKIDVHGDSDYWPVDFFGGPIFRQSHDGSQTQSTHFCVPIGFHIAPWGYPKSTGFSSFSPYFHWPKIDRNVGNLEISEANHILSDPGGFHPFHPFLGTHAGWPWHLFSPGPLLPCSTGGGELLIGGGAP